MNTFLQNIASDLLCKYGEDLHNITVVFPNKRASLFLNHELALQATKPLWSPQYTTISELFQHNSSLLLADRIKLVFELYKSYCKVTGSTETLEQFYGWGELMLSDFDDIDKHLGDAKKIFALLGDLHELDSVDYLTKHQQEVLQQFFRNFSKDHTTELKQRFLKLWNKFYDIYADYKERLLSQNIAYEGLLYREAFRTTFESISNEGHTHQHPSIEGPFIFIGFNYLTTVEERLIAYYVKETNGKIYEDKEVCLPKEISFISSPTDDLQARYVAQWLTPERIAAGRKTAIVLADESLLETVLHCLPANITLNITIGYPLTQSPVSSLVNLITNLLTQGSYTLHNINAVLRHPLAQYISPEVSKLHDKLNHDLIYYLTPEELSLDENLKQLFSPLKNKTNVVELIERLSWVVKTIAISCEHDAPSSQASGDRVGTTGSGQDLTTEALYRMYTLLNRLKVLIQEDGVMLGIGLFSKLLQQIIQGTTIPFHGEPIEGIQIMGVLETRNLDFDHLLLLSCNEGKIPAKINDASFLPHSVRIGYNLTTIENKVGIYENYFNRLLQRTNDISIVYNNSTIDGKTGEMSRFMLQLLAEAQEQKSFAINQYYLKPDLNISRNSCKPIEKTQEMIDVLLQKEYISPSVLGQYLRCPLKFYYQNVLGIRDDKNNDEEEMDAASFGTIFHTAAELFYRDFVGKIVPHEYLKKISEEKGHPTLRIIVERAFRKELFNIPDEDHRPTPRLSGLQVINFEMVVTFLVRLLRYDASLTRLEIKSLEEKVTDVITINTNNASLPPKLEVRIGGKIDRLDIVTDSDGVRRMRVIDYKTGRLSKNLVAPDISTIFYREDTLPNGAKKIDHADYFIQALLYSYIISKKEQQQEISAGLLYVQQSTAEDYDPLLHIGSERLTDATPYLVDYQQELSCLISEIMDLQKPFCPTSDAKQCEKCPFINFCH